MIERFSQWLVKVSKGWLAIAALVVFLLFTALVLPNQSARPTSSAAKDAGSPDTSFIYSPSDLYRMAEAYGAQGRADYVHARYTFDVVWPLVYTFFLLVTFSWAVGKVFAPISPWRRINLLPLLPLLFDYLENLSTSLVMLRYPAQTAGVDVLAPIFTLVKWLSLGASFILLVACMLILLFRALRKKR